MRSSTDRRPASLRRPTDALAASPIGISPIVWNNVDIADLRTGAGPDWLLDEIARLGYEGTQLGLGFAEGEMLRRALADRGLRLAEVYASLDCTTDGPAPHALHHARARLDLLARGGGEVLVLACEVTPERDATAGRAWAGDTPRFTENGWQRFAAMVETVARDAIAAGARAAFHQHAGTLIETSAELERLAALTDPELIGVCLDVGHWLVAGDDPAAAVRRFGDRITHVHLKDVDPLILAALRAGQVGGFLAAVRERLFTELGAGALDLAGVLKSLVEVGFDGWLIVEQDSSWSPPSEAAAIGRRVLAQALHDLDLARMT